MVHPADVHMEAGRFSDPDGDTHAAPTWEIGEFVSAQVAWHVN